MAKVDFQVVDVLSVRAMERHRLRMRFSHGAEGVKDFTYLLGKTGEMVEPLKDQACFERVFVEMGAPTWPDGSDMAPEWLRREMAAAGELHQLAAE
jgi:hypothetical protein